MWGAAWFSPNLRADKTKTELGVTKTELVTIKAHLGPARADLYFSFSKKSLIYGFDSAKS